MALRFFFFFSFLLAGNIKYVLVEYNYTDSGIRFNTAAGSNLWSSLPHFVHQTCDVAVGH